MPKLGCPVIYGVSDNDMSFWDNREVAYLGWKPQDNGESFRTKVDAAVERPAPDAPDAVFQGGMFTADGIHQK